MKRIAVFSGNRAEFGILFPIIAELSRSYDVEIILSGAHVLPRWNTYEAVVAQLDEAGIRYRPLRIELPDRDDVYALSLGIIYERMIRYYKENDVDYGIVLGDRVESFGFALATFYSRVPLVHLCGGDVTDVANFDTNVRHSITKIADYHMATSESSRRVLLQLGEEEQRIVNIGNPSFDYERMGYLPSREELMTHYHISAEDSVGILTFHPAASKSAEENMREFETVFRGVADSDLNRLFVTYPNNDPGHDMIMAFLARIQNDDRIQVLNSFGTFNYLGMMRRFRTIILGNSSSGLLETPYYQVPVLNIGERQRGRIRASNVVDCEIDAPAIREKTNEMIRRFDELRESCRGERFLFGDGQAALKARSFLQGLDQLNRKEQLYKKFVVR